MILFEISSLLEVTINGKFKRIYPIEHYAKRGALIGSAIGMGGSIYYSRKNQPEKDSSVMKKISHGIKNEMIGTAAIGAGSIIGSSVGRKYGKHLNK